MFSMNTKEYSMFDSNDDDCLYIEYTKQGPELIKSNNLVQNYKYFKNSETEFDKKLTEKIPWRTGPTEICINKTSKIINDPKNFFKITICWYFIVPFFALTAIMSKPPTTIYINSIRRVNNSEVEVVIFVPCHQFHIVFVCYFHTYLFDFSKYNSNSAKALQATLARCKLPSESLGSSI